MNTVSGAVKPISCSQWNDGFRSRSYREPTFRRTRRPVLFWTGNGFGAPDRMKLGTPMSLLFRPFRDGALVLPIGASGDYFASLAIDPNSAVVPQPRLTGLVPRQCSNIEGNGRQAYPADCCTPSAASRITS